MKTKTIYILAGVALAGFLGYKFLYKKDKTPSDDTVNFTGKMRRKRSTMAYSHPYDKKCADRYGSGAVYNPNTDNCEMNGRNIGMM